LRKKILMFGWEFPPFISGGLGVACHDLTKALKHYDLDINFVLPTINQRSKTNSHVDLIGSSDIVVSQKVSSDSYNSFVKDIDFITVDSILSPYMTEKDYLEQLTFLQRQSPGSETEVFFKLQMTGQYGPDLLHEVLRYAYVARTIAKNTAHDLIHVHDWMTALAGIEAKKISGKPMIYHVHALETDRSGLFTNKEIFEIEKHALNEADKIIAVSYFTKNNIINYYGVNPDKIEVVHNAVSKEKTASKCSLRIKKTEGEKFVLFLGRITFQKGPDYFLEAAAKVLKLNPNTRFIIAGHGDMLTRLIDRAAQLKIGRNVMFTGFLNRDEVEELFAASDVYVMSSVSEPFGISSLEAALFDVPVIISKQSGVAEVLSHSLKVDFWDVNELANSIHAVINYPALKTELFTQASEELKSIQWEKSAQKVVEIYDALLS